DKDYGGNVTSVVVFPISIYEDYDENLQTYNRYKSVDRFRNVDNEIEYCLNVNILLNPLDVEKLSKDELKKKYCDLIVNIIENEVFKLPRKFDFHAFKEDFLKIVDDFKNVILDSIVDNRSL
ncbi:MAG: hypothetical protein ACKOXD_03115, partial [Acinetobacter sp.]